jgi:predicted amidohydrolase YtcJ
LTLNNTHSEEECVEIAAKHFSSLSQKELGGSSPHPSQRGLGGYSFSSQGVVWLYGTGWNQELWTNNTLPTAKSLDSIFPDTPVCLMRIDYHAAWVNSVAMRLAGIDIHTPDPDGGSILHDKSGNPTGLLLDNAMELVRTLIPKPDDELTRKYILDSVDCLASKGLIEVHDADLHPRHLKLFRELNDNGKLKIRIKAFITAQDDEWIEHEIQPFKSDMLDVCGIKLYSDGALGSRGAALLEPYSDDPSTKGLLLLSNEQLFQKSKKAIENGWQVAVHAIGDAGCRQVINVFSRLRKEKIADENTILRLEHVQTLHPDDVQLLAESKAIASIQPVHCISDARMAEKRLGDRCNRSYLWRTLLDAGISLMAGSDFPIEPHAPLIGIDALIRRIPFGEDQPWYPDERLSINDALNIYTNPPAHRDYHSTKLSLDQPADITILDKDLYEIKSEEILNTKVLATIVDGKIVYSR